MLGLGNHHSRRDKAILSSHPISGPPESRPIITNHIGLHPWSFSLCVMAFDLITEETYVCLPFHHRCVCIFCVRIKRPSGEVKWIEWIFCERVVRSKHLVMFLFSDFVPFVFGFTSRLLDYPKCPQPSSQLKPT